MMIRFVSFAIVAGVAVAVAILAVTCVEDESGPSTIPDVTPASPYAEAFSSARETDSGADNSSQDLATHPPSVVASSKPPDFEATVVSPLPEEGGKWSEIHASLAPAAAAGDPEANYRLFRVAYECYRGPRTEKRLQESKERAHEPFLSAATGTEEFNPDVEVIVADLERTYERCKGAPDVELARYPQWLTTAADAGYLRALLDYSSTSFLGDEKLDPLDANDAAEMQHRAETSLDFLEEAERMGSIDAIAQLAFRYGEPHGPDHKRDPVKAFAYWYAYAWYKVNHENESGMLSDIDPLGIRLSPLEFQLAIEEGRRILKAENCCLKVPGD